ncbi:HTH_Tnp_Tc3_2 domain-containing protein [Trichonephila clavipes]|nr:HTH_Tnp_Tc3_2 domain-containing protein [Trichonephila clavipes]
MHSDLGYLSTTEKMPRCRIRANYEQLSEFERGRVIGLKEASWANRRIALHMGRSDVAIRRCCQEWVDNDRFQCHDGSGRPRATTNRED